MKKKEQSALDLIVKARTNLVLERPLLGMLALGARPVEDNSQPTFWINGREMGYNAEFTRSLPAKQLETVIAHEAMHIGLGHPWRRCGRDPRTWNEATDHAINLTLAADNFIMPKGALMDARFRGLSAEDIYAILEQREQREQRKQKKQEEQKKQEGQQEQEEQQEQEQQQDDQGDGDQGDEQGDGDDQGDGEGDDGQPGEGGEGPASPFGECRDAPPDCDQDSVKAVLIRGLSGGADAGERASSAALRDATMPATPSLDWRDQLREFATANSNLDYSLRRPSRRHVARGMFLPSLHSDNPGRILVAIDTSASINRDALAAFLGEVQAVLDDAQPECIQVVCCDTAVRSSEEYYPGDAVDVRPAGGGGTLFAPAFDMVDGHDAVIYFTDLEMYRWEFPEPDVPVLWVCPPGARKRTPPFGTVTTIRSGVAR